MNIRRYVNGKPVSQSEFKTLEIRNKGAEKVLEKATLRLNAFEGKHI